MSKRQDLSIGSIFRKSLTGKALKLAITNKYTMSGRDRLLNKILKDKPQYKRFIQYLTGGVKGDKITTLSSKVKEDVIRAHQAGNYPNRNEYLEDKLTGGIQYKNTKEKGFHKAENPAYNPNSNLLSTYGVPDKYEANSRTMNQLGHALLIPTDTGAILKDKWKVDEMPDDKWNRMFDLSEGGVPAALAYRVSKFFGLNKAFDYEVPFTNKELLAIPK